MGAAGNKEYGPGGVGRRKSSIWIRLIMVFLMVRESGQKQENGPGSVKKRKSSIWRARTQSESADREFAKIRWLDDEMNK